MVINFNLALVWIPMCKYTLTKLAVMACRLNSRQKNQLSRLVSSFCSSSVNAKACVGEQASNARSSPIALPIVLSNKAVDLNAKKSHGFRSASSHVAKKLMILAGRLKFRIKCRLCELKIDTINSFLVAVDHATSLHTISATTITLASGKSARWECCRMEPSEASMSGCQVVALPLPSQQAISAFDKSLTPLPNCYCDCNVQLLLLSL